MNFANLHCHSQYSLLDGLSKAEQIAERTVDCKYNSAALSDHGNLSGIPSFFKAIKEVCACGHQKKNHFNEEACQKCNCSKYNNYPIKPIAGCEFYISQLDPVIRDKTNSYHSHLVVLAKNINGWKNLVRASSSANSKEHFYKKPRLDLQKLSEFSNNSFIVFSGHMGSDLANVIFKEPKLAYLAKSESEAKSLAKSNWSSEVFNLIDKYQSLFGKENFYLEIQLIDRENLPASAVVAEGLRWCAKKRSVPCVATADSHYCRKEDAADQRILLCSYLETTLKEIQKKIENDENISLGAFFKSNRYHIPSYEELKDLHSAEELNNSIEISNRCEIYEIGGKPLLPSIDNADEKLRELCRKGWGNKIVSKVPKDQHPVYSSRIKEELNVLTDANLSAYFLIVQDYIRYAKEDLKSIVGKGRGSSAGSLVAYLSGITEIDPVKNGLLFERFFNASRKNSYPDIDTDFQANMRKHVIEYIRNKYGRDKVCQMSTFGRMQGRGALKDVLRAHERCSFEEMNKITEYIPDESKISDQLQEMVEAGEEPSIIMWALENESEKLKEWCFLNDKQELDGPLALDFAQAIRLEGTKRSQGKHASGIIISGVTLSEYVPMIYDKSEDELIVGVDMQAAESIGLIKFDVLSLSSLDCIKSASDIIKTGKIK